MATGKKKDNFTPCITVLCFSAQSSGLLCEENDGQSGPTVKYVGYCQFHWNKKVTHEFFCNIVLALTGINI